MIVAKLSPFRRAALAALILAWPVSSCTSRDPAASKASADTLVTRVACAPRVGAAMGLSQEWQLFASFIDVCRVETVGGTMRMAIVTVSAKRYYADRPSGAESAELPKPLVLDADGQELGRLPYGYPDDPPVAVELSFLEWRDGRPQQIDIMVRDPTASGDHKLTPLRWDAVARRYVGGLEH